MILVAGRFFNRNFDTVLYVLNNGLMYLYAFLAIDSDETGIERARKELADKMSPKDLTQQTESCLTI
jgi:hypothetical protein